MKALTVVVTHNRCNLLGRCIDNLLTQTSWPDAILVANNASSDNTVEVLERRSIPFVTQEKVGSAGGWQLGIEQAMDHGFDAVWPLM